MNATLGVETPLLTLTDDRIIEIVQFWRKLHPKPAEEAELEVVSGASITLESIMQHSVVSKEVKDDLLVLLGDEEIADLEAVFYTGRDNRLPEQYEDYVVRIKQQQAKDNDLPAQLGHLVDKTNFAVCVARGARRLGRTKLAELLDNM